MKHKSVVIQGYGNNRYELFDNGVVVALGREGARGYVVCDKLHSQQENSSGYFRVYLNLTGKTRGYFVHRLVATFFVDNPKHNNVVNHKDGNKHNNNYLNLEWVTSSENNKHAYETKLKKPTVLCGEKHGCHKLTQEQVNYIRNVHCPRHSMFGSKALSVRFGVNPQTITDIVHNRSWITNKME